MYGTPYLGGAASAQTQGLVPIQATQLSHAAAIAAATNQFYEYQVNLTFFNFLNICGFNHFIHLQNAVAAAAASPYQGQCQYTGFEAYPYSGAAGNITSFFLIYSLS